MSSSASPVVRRALVADLPALMALEEASFAGDRLSARQYRHHVGCASSVVLVADLPRARVVGCALVLFRRGTRIARLYSLATAAAWRGHGIATHLLDAVAAAARERGCAALRLEVRADNDEARALYARVGFSPIGTRPGYYEDGADARRLQRTL